MKDFRQVLLAGEVTALPLIAIRPAPLSLDAWEESGDVTWLRLLAGQPGPRFRPRWLAAASQATRLLRPPPRLGLGQRADFEATARRKRQTRAG